MLELYADSAMRQTAAHKNNRRHQLLMLLLLMLFCCEIAVCLNVDVCLRLLRDNTDYARPSISHGRPVVANSLTTDVQSHVP